MATRTYPCLQASGEGFPNLGPIGTVAAAEVGTPPVGYNSLNDGLDSTYFLLSGSVAAPSGLLPTVDLTPSGGGPKGQVPGNAAITAVSFITRAALGSCASASLSPYQNTFARGTAVAVPSTDFTAVTVPMNGPYSNFLAQVNGLVAEADCPAGGPAEVKVAEASMELTFAIPTPIVTTLAAGNEAPNGATLQGTLIVNQQQIEDGGLPNRFSHEFPVTAQFEIGVKPDELAAVGPVFGPYFGTIPGNNYASPFFAALAINQDVPLAPNTIYYYRLTATTEDGTVNGDTVTFTTPLTDRIKGVF